MYCACDLYKTVRLLNIFREFSLLSQHIFASVHVLEEKICDFLIYSYIFVLKSVKILSQTLRNNKIFRSS